MKHLRVNVKNKVMLMISLVYIAIILFLIMTGCYLQATVVFAMACFFGLFLNRYLGSISNKVTNSFLKCRIESRESGKMSVLGGITARLMHSFVARLAAVQNINRSINEEVKYIFKHCENDGKYYKVSKSVLELISNRTSMSRPELAKMIRSVERIARVSEQMSSKIEIPFSFSELLEKVKGNVDYSNIKVQNNLEKHLTLKMGERALFHVLKTYINNSVDEYKRLAKTTQEIGIVADKTEKHIVVKVYDYGEGLSEKDKESIFNRIYSTKSQETHLGMSLCLAKMSVNAIFEGEVWYEEHNAGKGAVFCFSIPNDKIVSGTIGGF